MSLARKKMPGMKDGVKWKEIEWTTTVILATQ